MKKFLLKNSIKILALGILFVLYVSAKLPTSNSDELEEMADRFAFTIHEIILGEDVYNSERKVHSSYDHISAWISSVGAACTFTDISGKRIVDDLILTDPRTDKVYVLSNGTEIKNTLAPKYLEYDSSKMAPMGTLAGDFDQNGEIDILVYYWGRAPIIFYQKNSEFQEKELTEDHSKWFSNAGVLADVNGDGGIDIIIGNYFPDSAHVLDTNNSETQYMQHSMSRADNGAQNRLFISDTTSKTGFREVNNWLNNTGTLKDWTLALAAADINNDLLPEIYIANDFGPDKFLLNESTKEEIKFKLLKGTRSITTMASSVVGKDSFKGMGADFSDINGDGLLDIYVSNIAAEYALEETHFLFINTGDLENMKAGIAPYENKSEELGLSRSSWGWDCKLADFNNDGEKEAIQATGFIKGETNRWAELHEVAMGNDELLSSSSLWHKIKKGDDLCGDAHNPFFVRNKKGYFIDIASQLGIDKKQVSRGIAISDIDHDGDLDFVVANQWDSSRLYVNNNESNSKTGAFVGLNIYQSIKNPNTTIDKTILGYPAIGCQAKIISINGKKMPSDKQLVGYVNGGNGHSGVSSHEIHFGLGKIKKESLVKIELQWIDRKGNKQEDIITVTTGWHKINLKQQ